MDKLWAPWRINYIQSKKKKGCIFCEAVKTGKNDFIIFKNKHSFAILNKFPYNNGHVMVSPLRHLKDISMLSKTEILDLFESINKTKRLLDKVLKPHGYNMGINLSKASGAGVPGHLHIHIVPRWHGDTNFMTTVYGIKVISQSLKELHKKLKDAQQKPNKRIRR